MHVCCAHVPPRLLRSLGDRCREVSVLRTATEAALALGAVRQATGENPWKTTPEICVQDHQCVYNLYVFMKDFVMFCYFACFCWDMEKKIGKSWKIWKLCGLLKLLVAVAGEVLSTLEFLRFPSGLVIWP